MHHPLLDIILHFNKECEERNLCVSDLKVPVFSFYEQMYNEPHPTNVFVQKYRKIFLNCCIDNGIYELPTELSQYQYNDGYKYCSISQHPIVNFPQKKIWQFIVFRGGSYE